MDYNLYMTIKDSLGLEVNSVLWRLNVLLQNGYSVNLRNGMVYYSESKTLEEGEPSEVVSLIHTFKKELDLFLKANNNQDLFQIRWKFGDRAFGGSMKLEGV